MGLHLYASPGGIHFTYQEARVRLFRFQMQMYFTIVQGQSIPKVTPPKTSGLDGNGVFADVLVRCLVRRGHWPWPCDDGDRREPCCHQETPQATKKQRRPRPTPRCSWEDYPAQVWELHLGPPSHRDPSPTVLRPRFCDDLFWEAHASECLWSVTYAGDGTAI